MELPNEFELYGQKFISQHCETCNEDIPNNILDGHRSICPYCRTPFKANLASYF